MSKQKQIPGTEGKVISAIDEIAVEYVKIRDKRMELTKKEHELQGKLVAALHEHKVEVYRVESETPPLIVSLVNVAEKAKVKRDVEEEE